MFTGYRNTTKMAHHNTVLVKALVLKLYNLKRSKTGLNSDIFPSPKLVSIPRLKNPFSPTLYSLLGEEQTDKCFSKRHWCKENSKQDLPAFELESPISFLTSMPAALNDINECRK